jgi:uncharacterized protein DUF4389
MAMNYGPPPVALEQAAPVLVAFEGPTRQRRITVAVRLILVIPAFIVLDVVGIAAFVVVVISWFGALFMGRIPRFAAEFLPGYLRWQVRVFAYALLLTDKYPPFSLEHQTDYPIWLTAQPGRLNRWAVFFRVVLVFPASVVSTVVLYGALFPVAIVAWFIVLISGRMPTNLYWAYAAVLRYWARVNGYELLITSEWPWGLMGDQRPLGFDGPQPTFGAYGVPGAFGAPPTSTYGAPPAYGSPPASPYAAPPAYGAPEPAPSPAATPSGPTAPVAPTLPGVDFTFGGPSYLWGYTADRSQCGIWSATDLAAPAQMWPIGEQGEAWTRFWQLEPAAVEFQEPPPPSAAPWSTSAPAEPGPSVSPYGSAAPSAVTSPYTATPGYPPSDPGAVAAGAVVGGTAGAGGGGGQEPTGESRWRLLLPSGARKIMVFFIILGVVVLIVSQVVQVAINHPFRNLVARVELQTAYNQLDNTIKANQSNNCGQVLSCFTTNDRNVAAAFGTFATSLNSIAMPSDLTQNAANTSAEATQVQRVFSELAASTSFTQYQENLNTSGLVPALRQFQSDYNNLATGLNQG